MTPYSKMSQTAIAAASVLAEAYSAKAVTKLNSADIAQRRDLPQPMIAKVLTVLSQGGLAKGSPGPGGGYWLSHSPNEISLFDIVTLFERVDDSVSCPFGPSYCGTGPRCPIHDDLVRLREQSVAFLKRVKLAAFIEPQLLKLIPATKSSPRSTKRK